MMGAQDAQVNYQASRRNFFSGCTLASGAAFAFLNFSGTAWGFGPHGNTNSSRLLIAASGADVSFSHDGTNVHGLINAAESIQFDGMSNVVDVYVNYLRNKIDADWDEKLLHTVRGVGYVMRRESEE